MRISINHQEFTQDKKFPHHWNIVQFTEAFQDKTGGQPKLKKNEYSKIGELPIIDQGQKLIGGFTNNINLQCQVDLPCILFGDHTKIFKFIEKPFAIGADGIKVLSHSKNIDPKFAYYYLNTLTFPDLGYSRNFRFLKSTFFPIPPIEEQKRIVAILDKADEIRGKYQQQIKLTEELLESLFIEMFGDPQNNPKAWKKVDLKNIIKNIDYGYTASALKRDSGIKFLRISDIKENTVNWDKVPYCECNKQELSKYKLSDGDLVLARTGATSGKSFLIRSCPKNAVFASYLIRIKPLVEEVNPIYLSHFLKTQYYWYQITKNLAGTTQLGINASKVKNLSIILPPTEVQNKFSQFEQNIQSYSAKLKKQLATSHHLFNSLLQKAFRGEL